MGSIVQQLCSFPCNNITLKLHSQLSQTTYLSLIIQSQLAAAAAATAVTPSSMEHNVGALQQSSVQHLTSQMNQLQMSGSQYLTSPVHGSFSQASWQMMHQHGQPQHPHPHYMSVEVRMRTATKKRWKKNEMHQ